MMVIFKSNVYRVGGWDMNEVKRMRVDLERGSEVEILNRVAPCPWLRSRIGRSRKGQSKIHPIIHVIPWFGGLERAIRTFDSR